MTKPNLSPFPLTDNLALLKTAIQEAGGTPIVVGGAVRDHLLNIEPKDIDIEVFNLPLDQLELALSEFKVDSVGKAFGVLKVNINGETFDVSLPRRESKTGSGHRDFDVQPDHLMTFEQAANRRDFTINAIGWDFKSGFMDPFGGINDLEEGLLRCVNEKTFIEDPLRILRGCQFAGRFNFQFEIQTQILCCDLSDELKTISTERFWEEFKKLLLKSPKPSVGLEAIYQTWAINHFPELAALIGVPENPYWHTEDWDFHSTTPGNDLPIEEQLAIFDKAACQMAEGLPDGVAFNRDRCIQEVGKYLILTGGVWVHNCKVVDGAAQVLREDAVEDETERLIVMLGALCHDLGKPLTTKFMDGKWRAHAHSEAGIEPTRSFLGRIGCPPAIIEAVIPLVISHLKPAHFFRDQCEVKTIRRLAREVPIKTLLRVARADYLGSGLGKEGVDSRTIDFAVWMMEMAEKANVVDSAPKPLLLGRHLIALGMKPGIEMGVLLRKAFEVQLDGGFADEVGALKWLKDQNSGH